MAVKMAKLSAQGVQTTDKQVDVRGPGFGPCLVFMGIFAGFSWKEACGRRSLAGE